jgi:hypothetical protein
MNASSKRNKHQESEFSSDGIRLAKSGDTYKQFCSLETFDAVVHEIDERGDTTSGELWDCLNQKGHPCTQISVAIAFLKERSILRPCGRWRFTGNGDSIHLEAMTEWYALFQEKLEA